VKGKAVIIFGMVNLGGIAIAFSEVKVRSFFVMMRLEKAIAFGES
jgi:hypothetical protein